MARWAIVCKLESGLTATFSKRGQVDWELSRAAASNVLNMGRSVRARGRRGYSLPGYGLYGGADILGQIDAVVDMFIVPEDAWSADRHHTVPFEITP